MPKKIFTEGSFKPWLDDMLIHALNVSAEETTFEQTRKLKEADIIFSSDPEKLKQHLRGKWKGIIAVLITDELKNSKTRTWGGKEYFEISPSQLGSILLMLKLLKMQKEIRLKAKSHED